MKLELSDKGFLYSQWSLKDALALCKLTKIRCRAQISVLQSGTKDSKGAFETLCKSDELPLETELVAQYF